jgi:hypothetical protein
MITTPGRLGSFKTSLAGPASTVLVGDGSVSATVTPHPFFHVVRHLCVKPDAFAGERPHSGDASHLCLVFFDTVCGGINPFIHSSGAYKGGDSVYTVRQAIALPPIGSLGTYIAQNRVPLASQVN